MRAAPGFAPRAIARLSRRIDIAKTPFEHPVRRLPKVAENHESRVNHGAVAALVMARRGSGKWGAAAPATTAADWSQVLTYSRGRNRRADRCVCAPSFRRTGAAPIHLIHRAIALSPSQRPEM